MELMYQSIPAAPSPHPGYCGAFACLFSPGGGTHLQILHFPVAGHFQDTHAVSYQHTQRILLKKKQISSSVKDRGL